MFDVRKSTKGVNTSVVADTTTTANNEVQQMQDDCYRELVILAKTIGKWDQCHEIVAYLLMTVCQQLWQQIRTLV